MLEDPFFDEFLAGIDFSQAASKKSRDEIEDVAFITIDDLDEECADKALFKYKVIKLVNKRLNGGWTKKNVEPIIYELYNEGVIDKKPGWQSVARWNAKYRVDKNLLYLVDRRAIKNNFCDFNSFSKDTFFWDAIEKKYLTRVRGSVATTYQFYKDLILVHNNENPDNKFVAVGRSAFYDRVKKLPPYICDLKRYGKRYADKKYRLINSFTKSTRVMERVEIDHTALDLILLDDTLNIPIGRPFITVLIDTFSKCIVGFYLSFRGPSYNSVRCAIINASLDKEDVLKKYPDVEKDWPCQGRIETLVVDNGAEFWSKDLERFSASIGMNIEYNPVGKPWKKPLVERIFNTYNTKFVHQIPGKTFSSAKDLEGYEPQKDALLPFSEFLYLLHIWVVDIYNQQSNSRKTHIPALSWQVGYAEFPPVIYQGLEKQRFKIESFPTVYRDLRPIGIEVDHISYSNETLVEFRKNNPPPFGKTKHKLCVKRDPSDVSYVYVYLPNLEKYIKVDATSQDFSLDGVSIFQYQIMRKVLTRYIDANVDHAGLALANMKLSERMDDINNLALVNKKSRSRGMKSVAAFVGIDSEGETSFESVRNNLKNKKDKKLRFFEGEMLDEKKLESIDDWNEIADNLEPY
ncbi:Mu transposase C-terminal domain-containing protein [Halomonas alkaliantarctica]|uniref:Mu transposase C-terminal domain-containing protein n=1 Tax=Halomonas alkaliantarctica TaxID=232346 RepID=UPI000690BBC7|nr:Mu transposase C-terminal domain-containing protein [Halomonas alkaliantarctica]